MARICNKNAILISIEEPNRTEGWIWPTSFYYLGGNIFSESNEIVTLEETDTTEIEALIKYE